ncbi:MAG: replication initiation protein [Candidatus Babeliales bacterium]
MKKTFNFSADSDVAVLNVSHLFGHIQQKMWNFMLSFAFKHIGSQKEHKISIARLANYLNIKDAQKIKEKLSSMVKDKDATDHHLYYYFETLQIANDTVIYSYPNNLVTLLENQLIYEITQHMLHIDFSTKYALLLYEFCLYYDYLGLSKIICLRAFRHYLGLSTTHYNNFSVFKNKILIPAIYEINTKTGLFVSIKEEREADNIIGLQIAIKHFNQSICFSQQPAYASLHKQRTSFLLENIALARYYKVPQIAKDNLRKQYEEWKQQKMISLTTETYKEFILQKFVAPFEIASIEESSIHYERKQGPEEFMLGEEKTYIKKGILDEKNNSNLASALW